MPRSRTLGLVATTVFVSLTSVSVGGAPLAHHVGAANPTTEGFTQYSTITAASPVLNDGGFDAWQVTGSGCCSFYGRSVDFTAAFSRGWRLTARLRVVSGAGYAFAGLNPFADYPRFDVGAWVVGGDTVIGLFDTFQSTGLSYTLAGSANAWILLELVYDPSTQMATLFVNGIQRLTGYRGYSQFQEGKGVLFGANGATGNFNLVTLDIPPAITSISPSTAAIGGPGFTLTVNGSNFVNGAEVRWNGSARTTTFVSSTEVRAAISASDIAATGPAIVTVADPSPAVGLSNGVVFTTKPTVSLDKTKLTFGAVTSGQSFLFQTAAQVVRLMQTGGGTVTWTAASNQPWLQVSPSSGTGSANLSISVRPATGLPPAGTLTGAITLTFAGAFNTAGPVAVKLNLLSGTSAEPFGFVDTPFEGRTGVTGAVPFTGWMLDDVEGVRVMICRAAVGSEVAPADPNCAGMNQIFVGFPVFIDVARPDVEAAYPEIPLNSRAGWGLMVLTNMLPSQGNGTFLFYIWGQDREGNTKLLGTRTITCDNAHATKPFGAIDTPTQGGLASGTSFVNFGWVLTPSPKTVPIDGSTISVLVDGAAVGTASYDHFRADIATLFPGLNNTNGAVGFRIIDTTPLTNGTHTIVWVVTDDQGVTEGIGSRFFNVSNGVGALTASIHHTLSERSVSAASTASVDFLPRDTSLVLGRQGWVLDASYRLLPEDDLDRLVVRSEEVNRIELQLGPGEYTGHLRVGRALRPLPTGSRLDAATGEFTWAPGPGFVGPYDLVFVRHVNGRAVARREVRIVLLPKDRRTAGPQVVIDAPSARRVVSQPFALAGWAVDLDSPSGTGIAAPHVWAYPLAGGPPVFVGTTRYGGARADVEALHGEEFRDSGFDLVVQGLAPGTYDLAVFAWSMSKADFLPARTVRVTVR